MYFVYILSVKFSFQKFQAVTSQSIPVSIWIFKF